MVAPAVIAATIPRVDSVGTSRCRTISFAISPGMMKPITWNPGSSPLNGPRANSTAAARATASVYATTSGRRSRNRATYPGTTTPPGERRLRSYQSMLTPMPMKTAVWRTSSLTPSVTTIGTPPQFFDDAVSGIRDHVAARERRPAGRCERVERREDLSGRRVLHVGEPSAWVSVPDRGPHESLRVAARHDDGGEIQFAAHRLREIEAPDRAVVAAVEEPDDRAAVDPTPAEQLRFDGDQRVDVIHPERADERVRSVGVPPFEELDRPEVGSGAQHPLDRAGPVEAEDIADGDGEGDVLLERDVRERVEEGVGHGLRIDVDESRPALLRLGTQDRQESVFRRDDRPVVRDDVREVSHGGAHVRADDLEVVAPDVRDHGDRRADHRTLGRASELRVDRHALDHDRLRALLRSEADDVFLFPEIRRLALRAFEHGLRSGHVDECRDLSRRLDDDPHPVRRERRADQPARPGLPATAVHVDPDRDRRQALRVTPQLPIPEDSDAAPE